MRPHADACHKRPSQLDFEKYYKYVANTKWAREYLKGKTQESPAFKQFEKVRAGL